MKQFAILFAAICLIVGGLAKESQAANYPLGTLTNGSTSPIGGSFTTTGGQADFYTFSLQAPALNSNLVLQYGLSSGLLGTFALFDSNNQSYSASLVSLGGGGYQATFSNLAAGLNYFLTFVGNASSSFTFYGGSAQVAATPIPPALLLFASALGGLGFVGYRRRKLSA